MKKESYFDFLEEDEAVLYKCEVGKRLIQLYVILSACVLALAVGFVPVFVLLVKHEPTTRTYLWGFAILIALLGGAVALFFYSFNLKNREYILTDKRLLFAKGGRINNYKRMIELSDIKGIERKENFILHALGVCHIDFFSPSIGINKKTFLKIFTLSSSVFMFAGIKREDADQMMKLTLKRKQSEPKKG